MENLETIKKIQNEMAEFEFYNCEDLTEEQVELVGKIRDLLYELEDKIRNR